MNSVVSFPLMGRGKLLAHHVKARSLSPVCVKAENSLSPNTAHPPSFGCQRGRSYGSVPAKGARPALDREPGVLDRVAEVGKLFSIESVKSVKSPLIKNGRLRATIQESFGSACVSDLFFCRAMSRSYAILIDAGFVNYRSYVCQSSSCNPGTRLNSRVL